MAQPPQPAAPIPGLDLVEDDDMETEQLDDCKYHW